ncbi:MAG TPA: prepilin-type N-terminal cleavage/methylation domain-containing protein, partial [Chromatiaceae bacterium]|nr:prepilin-type N-terminal cleavage/methylation domain-containing protein [Chromatiaceae bacterium]
MRRTPKGFTLIELMVTIVIVAILASIAIPSYTGQIQKSRRAEATASL